MKHKIAVLIDIHLLPKAQEEIQRLASNPLTFPTTSRFSQHELIERTNMAEAVLISTDTKITASYLDACPTVKYIGLCGTSTANINLEALKERNIVFKNVIDYGDEATAEFIFMQLLNLARGMGKYQWQEMPCELMGKSIGIVGLGALGKTIAHLALSFRMNTSYYSNHRKHDWEEKGLTYTELETLLQTNQIIILSTPTNVQILDEREFNMMKNGTVLVQASMGNPFNKEAFYKWIAQDGNFALFDYAAGEDNYQLYKDLDRVIFPKVIAGHSKETKERLGERVVENLKVYLKKICASAKTSY